jgi:hypothetical protein
MPSAWDEWSDQGWLDNADEYHAARLSADKWAALSAEKRSQAITTARTYLVRWSEHVNYAYAVYEQAVWLTTEDGINSIADYESVSVGISVISLSYGRSRGTEKRPLWISPIAWGLLVESIAGGSWGVGRVIS